MCTVLGAAATARPRVRRRRATGSAAAALYRRGVARASGAASSSTTRCCCTSRSRTSTTSSPASATRSATSAAACCSRCNVLMTLQPAVVRPGRRRGGGARLVRDGRAPGGCVFALPCVFFVHGAAHGEPVDGVGRAVRQGLVELRDHARRDPPLPAGAVVPGGVLAVHRRREHHHQDGGRLRPLAGIRAVEPDRGAAADAVRRVSGGARPSAGSGGRIGPRKRHLHRARGLRRRDLLRLLHRETRATSTRWPSSSAWCRAACSR